MLGLLLTPDKGTAALYLVFFGLYPVVKARLESMDRRVAEWALKLVFFNGVLTCSGFCFRELLFPTLPQWLGGGLPVLYGLGNLVFVLYDVGLSRLIALLLRRLP
ncbi:MAG: hypothetical protein V8S34_07980 [Lawsonibacter sp.]